MREIKVFGPGCQRCRLTEERVNRVLYAEGIEASVKKVSDWSEISQAGVLSTPAVAVDGTVRLSGRIPTEDEIRSWLKA